MLRWFIPPFCLLLLIPWLGGTSLAAQDTLVVRSDGPPLWRDVQLVEERRIGVLDGDDRYIFGRVSHVMPMPDGSVWVVDGQGPRVRIYDPAGRYVRDVFGPGQGPGEIQSVMGIDLTPDGRVAIWDLRNSRVSLYRPDGEVLGQFRVDSGSWTGESFQVDEAGRFWVYTGVVDPACVRTVTAPDGTEREVISSEGPDCIRSAYLRFSPGDARGGEEPADTVFLPLPQERERVPSFTVMLPEGNVQPFVPRWSIALSSRGYLVSAHSTRYALNLHERRAGGAEVIRIEREFEPVRLTREERAEWQGRADFYTRQNPGSVSAGVQIPEVKPALRFIQVDRDGRIWVNRYVEAEKRTDVQPRSDPDRPPALTWREPPTWDVFEPGGRFLGTVVTARGVRILVRQGDELWGVARGEFDEDYVVRYQLVTNSSR